MPMTSTWLTADRAESDLQDQEQQQQQQPWAQSSRRFLGAASVKL